MHEWRSILVLHGMYLERIVDKKEGLLCRKEWFMAKIKSKWQKVVFIAMKVGVGFY